MKRPSILTCFAPPDGFEGDFGWVCGFTANAEILADMADRFTSGARRRRPSLAIFLHPPETHLPLRRGVAVLFPRRGTPMGFNLLHAKVALLRFVSRGSSVLRLVVSTGNWTHDPLGNSLDLFWIAEWHSNPTPDGKEANDQAAADVLAAAGMFRWLRPRFDTTLLEVDLGRGPFEKGLTGEIDRLAAGPQRIPRFIDTRQEPLDAQVVRSVVDERGPARRTLLLGSGYYETGEDAQTGVLAGFVARLRNAGCVTKTCSVDVVLNPDACQGLAAPAQAGEFERLGWTLRPAVNRAMPGAKLHAKFVFAANGDQRCSKPWCYIGSGNLSGVGFTRSAVDGGNLEAGVVFFPSEPLTWEGVEDDALEQRLPINFSQETKPHLLIAGPAYQPPGQGADPPPVSYLRWQGGVLDVPDDSPGSPDLKVALPDGTWAPLPAAIAEPPAVATLAPWMAQVPVLADGGFVLPPLGPMRVEDVLHALAAFPLELPEERDREAASEIDGEEDAAAGHPDWPVEYPTRRMMRLIVALSERQAKVDLRDWDRWVTRVEEMLNAVTNPEEPAIESMRDCGIDPLSVLLHRPFLPPGLDISAERHMTTALNRVRTVWRVVDAQPLFPAGG